MKTYSLIILVSLTILFVSCGHEETEDDTAINYPDSGYFGVNILQMDSVDIRGVRHSSPNSEYHYSMCVQVPDESSVDIWMTNTSTVADANWSFEVSSRAGWIIIDYEYRKHRFVAIGPVFCDLELTFYERGSADLEIYENDGEEPARIKTISWHY